MKIPRYPVLTSCLATATFLATLPADAGFSSRRLGITSVPVGGESSDKDIMEIADRLGKPYPPINTPISAGDLATLQAHPTFAGKTPAQIHDKVVNIRRAVLCAIDLLRRTDPETAEGLHSNFRAGTLCIGLAPSTYHVGAAIQNDGKKAFNLEPINLYKIPCDKLTEGSPELFDLLNTLAHEGLHGRQDVLGWRDAAPLEVAKDRQCKEIDASQGELDRATEMCRIIDSIVSTGDLPPNTRGLYARMGATLLQELASLNATNRQKKLNDWTRLLRAIKARAGEVKTFREAFKNAADLALAGSPDYQTVLDGLRRHRLFQYYGDTNEFRPITRWYQSNAPRFVTPPGGTPRVEGNNEMRQLYAPLLEPETFTVTPLDTICTGYIADDRNLAMIGGIKFGSGPGGADEAVVVGYDIDPLTGRIMVETERDLLRSTEMAGGYTMDYNPFDGKFYAVQFGNNAICCLEDTTGNGEPNVAVPCGSLGKLVDDFDIGRFGFSDANTIFADGFESGDTSSWSDPILSGSRPPGGDFFPNPREEFRDSLERRPAAGGAIFVDDQQIPISGTPGGLFEVRVDGLLAGSGCFSPKGFACPTLNNPLDSASSVQIVEPETGGQSVPISPSPRLTERFRLHIDTNAVTDAGIEFESRVRIRHDPDQLIELHHGPGLDTITNNSIPGTPSNRFGDSFFNPPADSGRTQFFRGVGNPHPEPIIREDQIFFFPGRLETFDLSLNDDVPSSACYELVERPIPFGDPGRTLSEADFKLFGDGTFVTSLPTFAGDLSFKYRIRIGDLVTDVQVATIHPINTVDPMRNPTITLGADGQEYVEAFVIDFGGQLYPAYQFVMGPPEPVTPTSGCTALHWHRFGGTPAFAITFNDNTGILDLATTSCGYGVVPNHPLRTAIFTKATWDQFLIDHP